MWGEEKLKYRVFVYGQSFHQLKTDYYKYEMIYVHRMEITEKTCSNTKDKEKAYDYKKSSNHKGRHQERKKGIKKLYDRKQQNGSSLINNYFKWIKFSNQKRESG